MKQSQNLFSSFFNEFNAWLIIISFIVLILIKILATLINVETIDKEKVIRKIHFSGKVVEKGIKRGTYYLDFEDGKRIYLPNHELTQPLYDELKIGSTIRKRKYFSKIKVSYNGTTQYYKYPKNPISFIRNNLDDYNN